MNAHVVMYCSSSVKLQPAHHPDMLCNTKVLVMTHEWVNLFEGSICIFLFFSLKIFLHFLGIGEY